MILREYTLGLELWALLLWGYLAMHVKDFYVVREDRTPFRAAVAVVLFIAGTMMASTVTAIKIHQPFLITTWTPFIFMVFTDVVGSFIGVSFLVRAKMRVISAPPKWHPEHVAYLKASKDR